MLDGARAVGFVQVADTARARAFYEGVLGLTLRDDGFALVAEIGDAMLRITTLPDWKPAAQPAFGWSVPDASATAAALAGRGVEMLRYPFLGDAQGADGVWTAPDGARVAWFNDPDGNLLSITTPGAR